MKFTYNGTTTEVELNKYSKTLTQDPTQPATQAMFYGIGFKDEDFDKAQVGIVSMDWDGNPCNMHLNQLGQKVKASVDATEDLLGLQFHTIGVSDGIANGTDGMRYSLVSREVIADSIETNAGGEYYDGIVGIPVVIKTCQVRLSVWRVWIGHLSWFMVGRLSTVNITDSPSTSSQPLKP